MSFLYLKIIFVDNIIMKKIVDYIFENEISVTSKEILIKGGKNEKTK